jgi:hypothetical protein
MHIRKTLCAIVTAGSVLTMPLIAQGGDFGVGQVLGKTYAEWSAKWWQWAFDSEFAQFSPGDIDCAAGQKGAVWFLGGTLSGEPEDRTCIERIPRGAGLFFPLVNYGFWNPDASCPEAEQYNCTVAEKRANADGFFSDQVSGYFESYACQLSTTVDGVPVQDLGYPIVRTQSPVFPLKDVDDPETISDGYWVAVPPLPSGEHTIHLTGGLCNFGYSPEAIAGGADDSIIFLVDLTYHVTVDGADH